MGWWAHQVSAIHSDPRDRIRISTGNGRRLCRTRHGHKRGRKFSFGQGALGISSQILYRRHQAQILPVMGLNASDGNLIETT